MAGNTNINIGNKRAGFEYLFIDTYTAGIALTGTEIKSIRMGKASIAEAYCVVVNNEFWIRNMHIAEYDQGSYNNHEVRRDRKLLLNRTEIGKIARQLRNKGLTCIPLKMFFSESGYAKINIAVAQGKKLHDKRNALKEKDARREADRVKHIR